MVTMSGLWILGLGASLGYMFTKKEMIDSKLNEAVRAYDADGSQPQPPELAVGASVQDIKKAWKHTKDTEELDFNDRLPATERAKLLQGQKNQRMVEQTWDSHEGPSEIVGVFLESPLF
jgi:hypothetical protein